MSLFFILELSYFFGSLGLLVQLVSEVEGTTFNFDVNEVFKDRQGVSVRTRDR